MAACSLSAVSKPDAIADSGDEIDLQPLAVDSPGKIQQMHLEPAVALAEGDVGTDVNCRGVRFAVENCLPGVDSVRRNHAIDVGQICRGKVQAHSATVAVDDAAANPVRSAEHPRRRVDVPPVKAIANPRTGNDLTVVVLRLDDLDGDFVVPAESGQHVDVSAAATAEAEVRTLHHRLGLEMADEDLLQECIGGEVQKQPIRRIDDDRLDLHSLDQPQFAVQAHQTSGSVLGTEDRQRMGVKREDNGRTAHPVRMGEQTAKNRGMSTMDPVKVPDRDRPVSDRIGEFVYVSQDLHEGISFPRGKRL